MKKLGKDVTFWGKDGKVLDVVTLRESGEPVLGKRGIKTESGVFYKGAGVVYQGHHYSPMCSEVLDLDSSFNSKCSVEYDSGMSYVGKMVKNPSWEGKFGIFDERWI